MLSKSAVSGMRVVRTVDVIKLGNVLVRIQRRTKLGKDGGLSEIVKIVKNDITEEIWHIVTKAGTILHQHIKYKK